MKFVFVNGPAELGCSFASCRDPGLSSGISASVSAANKISSYFPDSLNFLSFLIHTFVLPFIPFDRIVLETQILRGGESVTAYTSSLLLSSPMPPRLSPSFCRLCRQCSCCYLVSEAFPPTAGSSKRGCLWSCDHQWLK